MAEFGLSPSGARTGRRHSPSPNHGETPRAIAGILALLLIAAMLLAAPAASATSIDEAQVRTDLELVDAWAWERFPATYGGVWLSQDRSQIIAGFIPGSLPSLIELQRRGVDLGRVRIVTVPRSLDELFSLQGRVDSERGVLNSLGIDITRTGIAPDRNQVVVTVRQLSKTSTDALSRRYGEGIAVEEGDYAVPMNRNNVRPPWVGGMKLLGVCEEEDCLLAGCTAGWLSFQFIAGIKFHHMLTAGHCFIQSSHVTNGQALSVGTVVQQFWAPGVDVDVEKITVAPRTQSGLIITADPTRKPVAGLRTVQSTNDVVCKSGITTDQTCSWDVVQIHATVQICVEFDGPNCVQSYDIHDQLVATRTSFGLGPGDSGGPVYTHEGITVRGHGLVSAGTSDGRTMIYTFLQTALTRVQSSLCNDQGC